MKRRLGVPALLLGVFLGCSEPAPSPRSNPQLLQDAEKALLLEQYERAAGLYETYLSENPNDPQRIEVRTQAGKCRLAAGHPDQAIREFDQALAEQPPQPLRWELLFRRSVAYRIQGDAARAVEGFRQVASAPVPERGRTVTNDDLHFEYALALFRTGDFKTGQQELRQVSSTGPYEKQLVPRLGLLGYTVQVGSYGNEESAKAEAAKLKGSFRAIPGPSPRYQVLVGSFPRFDEAQRELGRLQREGYTEAFILP